MSTEKNRYHITVTDNWEGTKDHDSGACVVIAAYNNGESTGTCINIEGSGVDLANALYRLELDLDVLYERFPEVKAFVNELKRVAIPQ